ncbi:MAG: hypothetical protein AAB225_13995 [Acidobacteriota bacterium]
MSALHDIARRARRRQVGNLLLARSVQAVSAGFGGVILLLLVGTEILDWRWIAALVLVTIGLGIHRTLRRIPSKYAVLQGIDWRLKLSDSLSTAWFFQAAANGHRFSQPMRTAQLEQAERLARGIDSARAVPVAPPRALYLLAALAAVAAGLFALRYAVSRQLDLRPPLASILFPGSQPPTREQVARQKQPKDRLKQMLQDMGLSVENRPERPAESLTGEALSPELEASEAVRRLDQPGVTPLQVESEEGDFSDETGSQALRSASKLTDSQGAERDHPASDSQQASSQPGENQNLLEQFREALANLLSRMKMQPRPGDSKMSASARAEDAGRSRDGRREKGASGSGRQQSEGSPGSESPDEEGQVTQQAQGASGRPGGKDADLQASREGRSGIGREDGDKTAREAEQLAAMGKISEILGRRQATLSGEVTVEVTSGTQKLRTPYTQQQAAHAEAGGESHRDEVPLLFQSYVQQYFEEIRKTPPAEGRP